MYIFQEGILITDSDDFTITLEDEKEGRDEIEGIYIV